MLLLELPRMTGVMLGCAQMKVGGSGLWPYFLLGCHTKRREIACVILAEAQTHVLSSSMDWACN